ncbi:MAG: hypothetical protein ABIN80_11945 [Dyadobacter sp.]|uniref:hypothetical protein n=1 Tax=Dyadobacter sp. TaxID=1914288 RepID=UPI003264E6F6
MTDLKSYERIVNELVINKSTDVSYTNGAENSTIVMENLFLAAAKEVIILTGSFHKDVCDDVEQRFVFSLKRFLLGRGKISVVMNDYNPVIHEPNSVLSILRQYACTPGYEANIQVRTTSEEVVFGNFNVHFMVADDSMYRLEYDTRSYLSEFCFNDANTSNVLRQRFDLLFKAATPFRLQEMELA